MCVAFRLDDRSAVPNSLADDFIAASGAHSSDRIVIAGAEQLDLLIEFARRGFANVACQSATRGPHSRTPATDILIAPSPPQDESGLLAIVKQLGCALRDHGVMILRASGRFERGDRHCQILRQAGFSAVERVPSRDAGELWRAYKQRAATARGGLRGTMSSIDLGALSGCASAPAKRDRLIRLAVEAANGRVPEATPARVPSHVE